MRALAMLSLWQFKNALLLIVRDRRRLLLLAGLAATLLCLRHWSAWGAVRDALSSPDAGRTLAPFLPAIRAGVFLLLVVCACAEVIRACVGAALAGTYSMADLQALEKRSSWDEILDHAEDIAPAQRNAAWDKLVLDAATGYLASATTKSDSYEGIFASQSLVQRYPHLTASPTFMAKRADAGKMAAETCLENAYRGQHCIDMMKDFLKTTNTDASVGFAFGKIARKNQNAYVAVPFFDWALAKKAGDGTMCGDDDLQLATVAGLGLPTDDPNAAGARRIAEGACWSTMKDPVTKGFSDSSGSYYRDNACAVLKAKGAL